MNRRLLGLTFVLFLMGIAVSICGCDLLTKVCPPCPECTCGFDECFDMVGGLFDGDD